MNRLTGHRFETAWGICSLSWSDLGLVGVRLPDPEASIVAADSSGADDAPPPDVTRWAGMLRAHFAGETVDFRAVPLDRTGLSLFETAICAALREIERGRTTTYGELAALAGHPGTARAVGTAMARNRWPIVVPCHRVLPKDGALGGFSASGGVSMKRRLLALEGAVVDGGTPLLPGLSGEN